MQQTPCIAICITSCITKTAEKPGFLRSWRNFDHLACITTCITSCLETGFRGEILTTTSDPFVRWSADAAPPAPSWPRESRPSKPRPLDHQAAVTSSPFCPPLSVVRRQSAWRSWQTSGQSNRVVSAYDRLCPSLAAGARQSKQRSWRTKSAFCPPLASAIAVGGCLVQRSSSRPARIARPV
jgi:hypothetical protein